MPLADRDVELKQSGEDETDAESLVGIGLDSCVLKTRYPDMHLVQTTDFFYPLVDDPYVQGRIAAANVLSDLYAMGVEHCDNVLMLLALSLNMSAKQRQVVTPLVMQGFRDACRDAGTRVSGGQTVLNPWMIVGGVASSVCKPQDYIMPTGGQAGDVLVLTKPLGTQPAVNAHQWLGTPGFDRIKDVMTPEQVKRTYDMAMASMAKLNRRAAGLMRKYGAHGATDVTGFGILGHAQNLAEAQTAEVDLVLDMLPILPGMRAVNEKFNFKLLEGFSAETSGGLLVMLPAHQAAAFMRELQDIDNFPCWQIGRVVAGQKQARLSEGLQFVDVEVPLLS